MPDKNQLIFEVKAQTNQAKTEVKKFGKGIDDVKRKSDKAGKSVNRLRVKTEGLRRTLGVVRNNLLLVTFALGGTVAIMKKAVDAFARQELAEKKLSSALGKTSQELLDQASALQQITTFGDEAVIGVQSLIAAFTDEEEQIKELTKTALDLASAKGMDLNAAADLVAKSFGSSTNALSRYGIEVTGAAGSTERLNSLTQNTARLFGGQASAEATTYAGKMKQMNNAMGDTAETIGAALAPLMIELAGHVKIAAEFWSEFFTGEKLVDEESVKLVGTLAKLDIQIKQQQSLIDDLGASYLANDITFQQYQKTTKAIHDRIKELNKEFEK